MASSKMEARRALNDASPTVGIPRKAADSLRGPHAVDDSFNILKLILAIKPLRVADRDEGDMAGTRQDTYSLLTQRPGFHLAPAPGPPPPTHPDSMPSSPVGHSAAAALPTQTSLLAQAAQLVKAGGLQVNFGGNFVRGGVLSDTGEIMPRASGLSPAPRRREAARADCVIGLRVARWRVRHRRAGALACRTPVRSHADIESALSRLHTAAAHGASLSPGARGSEEVRWRPVSTITSVGPIAIWAGRSARRDETRSSHPGSWQPRAPAPIRRRSGGSSARAR
mmetsp:Transcript_3666/g.10651  ORF Transcript_3666/g.10651 Transcript_3666/m.10651 type:complete len:282 (-) Transcript_3666:316-1161(-)